MFFHMSFFGRLRVAMYHIHSFSNWLYPQHADAI